MAWVVIASLIFGINPTLIAMSMARGMDSVSQVFWMYAINWGIHTGVCRLRRKSLNDGLSLKKILLLMAAGAVGTGGTSFLLAISYQLIGTGTSTVLHFFYPVVVSVASWIVWKKRLGKKIALAIVCSVCGVFLIAQGAAGHGNVWNFLPAILSSFTYGFYFMINGGRFITGIAPSLKCSWMSFGVWTSFGLYLLISGKLTFPGTHQEIGLVLLTGAALAIAYNCLVCGIEKIGPLKSAFTSLMEPLTSMAMGILVNGEMLTLKKRVGSLLVLISVFLNTLG